MELSTYSHSSISACGLHERDRQAVSDAHTCCGAQVDQQAKSDSLQSEGGRRWIALQSSDYCLGNMSSGVEVRHMDSLRLRRIAFH